MKIPTNKISSIIKFYRDELNHFYSNEEIKAFINLSMEHYLGFSATAILLKKDSTVTESELLKLYFVVKDLKAFKPIQYILGETQFYNLIFKVNESVLIPRPETEELVDLIIKENKNKKLRILDIGTGSGCIAIALKKNLPEAEIFGLDISEKALDIAKENAGRNQSQINFFHADILNSAITGLPDNLDIIVSNPPYIILAEKSSMHPNVLNYEPHEALFVSNNDSIIFYRAITKFASAHLKKNGRLYFEINEKYGNEIAEMLENYNFTDIRIIKDMSGKERIIQALFN